MADPPTAAVDPDGVSTRVANPPHLFISYASGDRPRVLRVVDILEKAGIHAWIDVDGITGGQNYGPEIVEGIKGCGALVMMCSAASLASRNVRQELLLAWRYGRPILPLRLEEIGFPEDLAYWLEGAQWIDVLDRAPEVWLPPVQRALEHLGLMPGGSPFSRGESNPPLPPPAGNLPIPPTPLVGRASELAEIKDLLAHGARLVTLTGPGGTGKTRLALEAARSEATAFPHGALFVDLAPLADPALVLPTVALALGVRVTGDQPPGAELRAFLRPRRLLLVLDNFEQVVAAAPVVAELLSDSEGLTCLVTSRAPLRLRGEREYPVPPLMLPEPANLPSLADLAAVAAIDLFVQRAQAARPDFMLTERNAETVAEVCRRLDGLPLAIELAAARLRLLEPETLLARLDDRLAVLTGGARDLPVRQQTLRDEIAWSHALLSDDERAVFRRLVVFAGGSDLEAAEAVCRLPGEAGPDVIEAMAALVGQSLVRRLPGSAGEPRFGMLETIRAFGLERLAESGEEEMVRERHLAYFVGFAERAEPELTGPDQGAWLDRLSGDVDNLRAAFERAVDQRDAATALRLGLSLWRFWVGRGLRREGRGWLERARAIDAEVAPALKAMALYRLGMLAIDRADYADAVARLEESLAISRAQGNLTEVGDSLAALGVVAAEQEDFVRAQRLYEEAYAIRRDHVPADQRGVALSLFNLAQVARDQYDYERAAGLYGRALAAWSELGDQSTVAHILRSQGISLRHTRDLRAAVASTGRALELFRELHDDFGIGWTTTELGRLALQAGQPDVAGARFDEVLRDPTQTDSPDDMPHNWVEAIEGMAWLALRQDDLIRSARLFAAAAEFRRRGTLPFPSRADRDVQEAAVTELSARLGAAWDEAAAVGRRLTPREATEDALRWRQVE